MQADGPLRRRLIAACVLLAVLIGGVFSAAAYVIVEAVEAELVQGRLSRAAKVVARSIREGGDAPSLFDLKSHIEPGIPQALRALPPGFHEVETDDDTLAVLVGEEGGRRYVVVDDISDFERLEFIAFSALAVALLAGVLLALAIARASANRIVSPISALADAVEHDRLAAHPVLLAAPDEIGVLARAFMSRAAELAAVLERERNFTADVSHELRTPLTVVLGAAELLTARLAERPDLLRVAQRILRTTSGMSEQVSALLQLARDPGRIERSTLALRDLLEREVERCRPLLDGKAVSLELDAPNEVWMQGNEDLAAIAIGNLLRNACHFTERGLVRATLRADRLAIEDTGPGIPAEVRGRLFEPFVRGDHSSTTGTGLGLSIVKRVADHLGWRVQHDDAPHGGARFTLIFAAP